MNEVSAKDEDELNKSRAPGPERSTGGARCRTSRMRWWMPTMSAFCLIVAVVMGMKSVERLKRAERMSCEAMCGSPSLEGVKACARTASEADRQREVAHIRKAREASAETFRASVEAEHEAFRRRVFERSAAFDVVRGGIPDTVDKYGFTKCWSIMYALAKDMVSQKIGKGSTANFDELLNADLRTGFYQPLQDARGEVLVLLSEFQARLNACRAELERNMTSIPDWDRSLGEPPVSLRAESLRIEETMAALRDVQIGATASAALDAACLYGISQTVARLLAGAAGRIAAGAVAGGVTAMADGPVPGPADLVGLGIFGVGAAATAWEMRKASKVVPEKLTKVMNETVDTQSAEVQRRTLDEGEKLYLMYTRRASMIAFVK